MTFIRTGNALTPITFSFDGVPVEAAEGDTIASALVAAGIENLRTMPSGKPRLTYCLMGVCFECLVEVDGERNLQACMIEVREGMQVRRNDLARMIEP